MPDRSDLPELVFALVGPIGCAVHDVAGELRQALKEVDYEARIISLSQLVRDNLPEDAEDRLRTPSCLQDKIDGGNHLRRARANDRILAAYALQAIKETRVQVHADRGDTPVVDGKLAPLYDAVAPGTAYILDQLKRLEEVDLLERVYGTRFIQVCVTESADRRRENLRSRTVIDQPDLSEPEVDKVVAGLIETDQNEEADPHGQRISVIFHLGDVFIDASGADAIQHTVRRFVRALFGKNEIGPTREEQGSFLAKAAALRSVDTSRQVGAAITTPRGEIVAMGCNDVPAPFGGQYWHEDAGKARDIDKGHEANKAETARIVHDLLRVLHDEGRLTDAPNVLARDANLQRALSKSRVGDITEYGRMVHAEMAAITEAARLGRALDGLTLYVTTFPCHNCAKHIVAAGIRRVVFIEPYPKSRALGLFAEAITTEGRDPGRVRFEHFSGISPKRYRDIFEKGRRRDNDGLIQDWYHGRPYPMIPHLDAGYFELEHKAIRENLIVGPAGAGAEASSTPSPRQGPTEGS